MDGTTIRDGSEFTVDNVTFTRRDGTWTAPVGNPILIAEVVGWAAERSATMDLLTARARLALSTATANDLSYAPTTIIDTVIAHHPNPELRLVAVRRAQASLTALRRAAETDPHPLVAAGAAREVKVRQRLLAGVFRWQWGLLFAGPVAVVGFLAWVFRGAADPPLSAGGLAFTAAWAVLGALIAAVVDAKPGRGWAFEERRGRG